MVRLSLPSPAKAAKIAGAGLVVLAAVAAVNRLAAAASPYLQQHADNPVDWHERGEEAFAEARRRDVPLLISIGYSACHWCHLML